MVWPFAAGPSAAPPPPPPPATDLQSILIALAVVFHTAVALFWLRRRASSPATLQKKLEAARERVRSLQAQLDVVLPSALPAADPEKKVVRIWMDGAFDMMHYGHVNAFRQGRALGTHLIVGVNDDESITRCKGPPVMNATERLAMVEGCKVRSCCTRALRARSVHARASGWAVQLSSRARGLALALTASLSCAWRSLSTRSWPTCRTS